MNSQYLKECLASPIYRLELSQYDCVKRQKWNEAEEDEPVIEIAWLSTAVDSVLFMFVISILSDPLIKKPYEALASQRESVDISASI